MGSLKVKLIIQSIIMVLLLQACIMVYNYTLDLYSVFRPSPQHANKNAFYSAACNVQMLGITNLLQNKEKYDSLLFGTSRVGFINVRKVKCGKYYNLWYPASIPTLWLKDLEYLLTKGIRVKQLVIGLDDATIRMDIKIQNNTRRLKPYPYTFIDKVKYYFDYLTVPPNFTVFEEVTELVTDSKITDSYAPEGMILLQGVEERINTDLEKHITSDVFKKPTRWDNSLRVDEAVQELSQIKKICDLHNIIVVFFFNPIHRTTYLSYTLDEFKDYIDFKRKLVEISPFYDFSGINSISMNNINFLETSHFRPKIGDMIMSKVLNQNIAAYPADFGVYVTKSTIEKHLSRQLEEFKVYSKKYPVKWDKTAVKF